MEQTSKDIPGEEQGPEIGQASVVWPRFQQVEQRFYGRLLILWIHSEFGVHVLTVSLVCQQSVDISLELTRQFGHLKPLVFRRQLQAGNWTPVSD